MPRPQILNSFSAMAWKGKNHLVKAQGISKDEWWRLCRDYVAAVGLNVHFETLSGDLTGLITLHSKWEQWLNSLCNWNCKCWRWQNRIHGLELEQKAALIKGICKNVMGSFMTTFSDNLAHQKCTGCSKTFHPINVQCLCWKICLLKKHCDILKHYGFASVLRPITVMYPMATNLQ